jgi:endonuclease YncB( thermonuclease family)
LREDFHLLRYQNFIPENFFMVVRVYDGGTIKAVGYDIEIKVRLVGIDAPETSKGKRKPGQPFGRKAEKHLAALVLNKIVDL